MYETGMINLFTLTEMILIKVPSSKNK